MKIKHGKRKFRLWSLRKKEPSVMETLRQERKYLLTQNNDFYSREAYKALRTNVYFSLTGEEACKVVIVTSSMPSEGKSTTAANLAISFAQAGKKTLIIDCDMRKPKLSRLLNLKSKVGLSNVLMNPQLCKEAVLHTGEHNMRAMTAGDIPPNPSELLGSTRMQELIKILRESFEYIILDTPPVNVVTDAVVLSPLSDGTLFVVRAGQSERGAVRRAVDQLERANAKLMGFVINGVDNHSTAYGKYRQGYQKSGYGYGENAPEAMKENKTTRDFETTFETTL